MTTEMYSYALRSRKSRSYSLQVFYNSLLSLFYQSLSFCRMKDLHLNLEGRTNDDKVCEKDKRDKTGNENVEKTLKVITLFFTSLESLSHPLIPCILHQTFPFLHFLSGIHSPDLLVSITRLPWLTVNSNRSVHSPERIGRHANIAPEIPLEQVAHRQSHVRLVRLPVLCHPVLLTTNKTFSFTLKWGGQLPTCSWWFRCRWPSSSSSSWLCWGMPRLDSAGSLGCWGEHRRAGRGLS